MTSFEDRLARLTPEQRALLEKRLRERSAVAGTGGTAGGDGIPRRRDPSRHPVSFAQERLWFLDRLGLGPSAFNRPAGLRLRGRLDAGALAAGFAAVARRHEGLRAFFADEEGAPV